METVSFNELFKQFQTRLAMSYPSAQFSSMPFAHHTFGARLPQQIPVHVALVVAAKNRESLPFAPRTRRALQGQMKSSKFP